MDGFLGIGDLYLDRLTQAGASQGYGQVGNADKFEVQVSGESVTLKSKMRDTAGQDLESVSRISSAVLNIMLNQISHENLANIFMGDYTARAGAGGSVTDESVTAIHDKWVQMAKIDISNVVVTDNTGVTTYDINDDYLVNLRTGMLYVVSTGAITDGQELYVDYDWAAESGYIVNGATQPIVKVRALLDGKNQATGANVLVKVWEAHMRPNSPVDFLSDSFTELDFTSQLITPPGQTSPFLVYPVQA